MATDLKVKSALISNITTCSVTLHLKMELSMFLSFKRKNPMSLIHFIIDISMLYLVTHQTIIYRQI